MFYLRYLMAELCRRPSRTALTALGLAIGIGLVVIVGALSAGLDEAQEEILKPLTGVGTDMSVTRPLSLSGANAQDGTGGFASLSAEERRRLEKENPDGGLHFEPSELGDPGEKFSEDRTVSSQLSFPIAEVQRTARLDGAEDSAGSLSLQVVTLAGEVPPPGAAVNPHGGGYDISSMSVTGVDVTQPGLAPVNPTQVAEGRYFSTSSSEARDEAILDVSYARQQGLRVGDSTKLAGKKFDVVGLSAAPLGGAASNAYLELGRLQRLTNRAGRVNAVQVRAESANAVGPLSRAIRNQLPGADVVTASELADRVSGSLVDAKNLSSKLGAALAVVALAAAFLIATMLSLSSVQKRVRELGTLKALGWRKRLVVRQVSAESVVQGLLGGIGGAAVGFGGAALVGALGIELDATVEQTGSGGIAAFGQGEVAAGSTEVLLGAPVDASLLALAMGLAVAGGLLAGAAGGLRAARLRPAEALRSIE